MRCLNAMNNIFQHLLRLQSSVYNPTGFQEPCVDPSMDAAALKKALEWELSLDSRDLRSHAWYHGAIPRYGIITLNT